MNKQNNLPPEEKGVERTLTAYNTVGSCQTEFKTSAKNWGQLKKELDTKRIPHVGMKAVVGENQQELTHDEDVLITQDISLFLTPIKVRSGE